MTDKVMLLFEAQAVGDTARVKEIVRGMTLAERQCALDCVDDAWRYIRQRGEPT